jgi:hypothetical protein
MAYREDLDAFATQRARDDDEAALLAAFRAGQRARRKRALAVSLGGIAVACTIYRASFASPEPAKRTAAASPRPKPIVDPAAADRRACAHWAVHAYLEWSRRPLMNVGAATGPYYTLNDFAASCPRNP